MFDFLIRCCRAQQQCKPSTDPQANQQRACGTMAVCVVVKRRTGGVAGPRQSLLPLATAVGLWWSRVRRGGWCLWLRVQRRSCVCSLSWAQIAEFCNSAVGQQQPGVTAANPTSSLHHHTREPREGCECCLSPVVVCIVGEYV